MLNPSWECQVNLKIAASSQDDGISFHPRNNSFLDKAKTHSNIFIKGANEESNRPLDRIDEKEKKKVVVDQTNLIREIFKN